MDRLCDKKPKLESRSSRFFKRFQFLRTLKSSIFSKLPNSHKYEVSDNSNHEIRIISYEQTSFEDLEDGPRALDVKPSYSLTIDQQLLTAINKLLSQKEPNSPTFRKGKLELVEIIEKTFTRQLDIFEELLQVVRSSASDQKNNEQKMDPKQAEVTINDFINDVIKNIVTQLMKTPSINSQLSASETSQTSNIVEEIQFGDNPQVNNNVICCECQNLDESGAAVPQISPTNESQHLNLE